MQKQQLSSSIKRARDIMRKDAGLSSDLDRTPQLAWVLFLKSFDELEKKNEALNPKHRSAIESPYRWRDWAANAEGKTGDELLKFVNEKLLPYLRGLKGTKENDPRDVLASLFAETYNRMLSGYLLREVVNLIDQINFQSKDDIFTLSHLYESILKEMRDAAGTSGEFYTPRPVVRFIVEMIKPKIGEKVLDPACGTGGFLVEAYEYMKKIAKTAEDWDSLQFKTLYGIEKKPMPYLLGVMNLILHGIEAPNIRRGNTLTKALIDITEKEKVNVVITNPPFGGEEEKGVQDNFPLSMRTSETALLFMQYIMRILKKDGRCGIIVPNGFLFDNGVAKEIRKKMISEFNIDTIVRLPNGVFAPYTGIETNILFFSNSGKTNKIFYYSLPKNGKNYTKTSPIQYDELVECLSRCKSKKEDDHSWYVDVKELGEMFNLNISNPKYVFSNILDNSMQIESELEKLKTEKDNQVKSLLQNTLIKDGEDTKKLLTHISQYTIHDKKVFQRVKISLLGLALDKTLANVNEEDLYKFVDYSGGSQPPKKYFKKEPAEGLLRLYQIRDYTGSHDNPVYIPKELVNKTSKKGDILIGRYGASLGKIFWADDGAYNVAIAKLKFNEKEIDKNFLFWYLNSPIFQNILLKNTRSAQAGFNKTDWKKFKIKMPSLPKQKELALKISDFVAIIEKIKEIDDEIINKSEQLILHYSEKIS